MGYMVMTGKYQAYPEYKDSGVEWLGKVPEHWEAVPLKRLCSLITGLTPPTENKENYVDDNAGYPWVRPEDLSDNGQVVKASKYVSGTGWKLLRHVSAQSTLICCIGTIGKVGYADDEVSTNQQITAARFIKSPRYNFYLVQSAKSMLEEVATGNVVKILNSERLGRVKFISVPGLEAAKIANFLDHETAKIDILIEKQQQLIKLLKEKRQAVISHAVTKGLNPDAPMKDSGVEWLGDVPEGWEIKRVGYACQIDNNLRTPIDRQTRMEMIGKYPYYGPTGILNLIDKYNVEGEYCLIGEDGDHFLKFQEKPMTIHVEGRFNVNNHAHLIKGKGSCSTKWACLYFEHKDLFPWSIKQGVSRYKLRKESLVDIPILVPPESEQEFILEEINKKKFTFDLIVSRAESLKTILKERRTSLVSAAVTGKIDVRNWKSPEQNNINKEDAV
ncbi:MAG: restriction modification system DNA specificity domain-containing protein [Candidatus Scalindua sp.]|nr:MAG: restriction modification system DNA specificity domain-containing protein [Candidatus Scalindua sp.]